MELTIALVISILSITFTIINFALGRKDKAVKDSKEEGSNQKLIEYRLDKVEEKLDQILSKFDRYDSELDEKIDRKIKIHLEQYHKGQ